MSSRCRELRRLTGIALALAALAGAVPACGEPAGAAARPTALRVCADPDNLPYSHADGSGFENRIAQVIADEMRLPLQTAWQPQLRGLVRKTLGARACDVLIGVPVEIDRVLVTRPYYRSGYVVVTRAADPAPLRSLDDPRLAALAIGVPLVGDDLAATPPGQALARRGASAHVTGFTPTGDGPAAQRMIAAVADGRLDAALVWGPQAGYFARRAAVPMTLTPAAPPAGLTQRFEFSIAMGVRRGDLALRDALDAAIERRRAEIDAILAHYRVPRTDRPGDAEAAR